MSLKSECLSSELLANEPLLVLQTLLSMVWRCHFLPVVNF